MENKTTTLPPIKKVNAAQLEKLLERMTEKNTALLVRTGLGVLAQMSNRDFQAALQAQARADEKSWAAEAEAKAEAAEL